MLKIEKNLELVPANCEICGKMLTNPGYNRVSRQCCGKYQNWQTYKTITREIETGRDEKGRYNGKRKTNKILSIED